MRLNTVRQIVKPAFHVFSNLAVDEIVARSPTIPQEQILLHGLGKQKVTAYGDGILQLCRKLGGLPSPRPPNQEVPAQNVGIAVPENAILQQLIPPARFAQTIVNEPLKKELKKMRDISAER